MDKDNGKGKKISIEEYYKKITPKGEKFLELATGNDKIESTEELDMIMTFINDYYDVELKNKTIKQLKNDALSIIAKVPNNYIDFIDLHFIQSLYCAKKIEKYDNLTIQEFLSIGENDSLIDNIEDYNMLILFVNHYYNYEFSTKRIADLKQDDASIVPFSLGEALKNEKYDNYSIINFITLTKLIKFGQSDEKKSGQADFLIGVLALKIIAENINNKSLQKGDLSKLLSTDDIDRKLRRYISLNIGRRFDLKEMVNFLNSYNQGNQSKL